MIAFFYSLVLTSEPKFFLLFIVFNKFLYPLAFKQVSAILYARLDFQQMAIKMQFKLKVETPKKCRQSLKLFTRSYRAVLE